ncbi:hypothetical protein EUGRSUZ_F01558 [Eucalyptus grandis]|uniref:Uncharacterized protein n=2 Tax=Eucalyptus grandis TaxID=71139 RepID=A0ACC3KE75_EUCGR|nr:hypothetical protein EUGRSUZ_F01558 [Eucalyptus grandis]
MCSQDQSHHFKALNLPIITTFPPSISKKKYLIRKRYKQSKRHGNYIDHLVVAHILQAYAHLILRAESQSSQHQAKTKICLIFYQGPDVRRSCLFIGTSCIKFTNK